MEPKAEGDAKEDMTYEDLETERCKTSSSLRNVTSPEKIENANSKTKSLTFHPKILGKIDEEENEKKDFIE